MDVRRMAVGVLEANCFIVSDGAGGPALVIDPGGDPDIILAALGDDTVAGVVLTHGHFDHLGGVARIVEATRAPLMVHALDAMRITHGASHGTMGDAFGIDTVALVADRMLEDGDVIGAGALRVKVLHTPGHTEGGICLFAEEPEGGPAHLFSGDTLFLGSVGRTDFPGGDARTLSRSIAQQLAGLPESTIVHPGHGPDTTVGREARLNQFWPRA